jgi:hypothetical protein
VALDVWALLVGAAAALLVLEVLEPEPHAASATMHSSAGQIRDRRARISLANVAGAGGTEALITQDRRLLAA